MKFDDDIPGTESGKIKRPELKELALSLNEKTKIEIIILSQLN